MQVVFSIYNHVGKGTVGSVELFIFFIIIILVIRVCLRIENGFTEIHIGFSGCF